MAFQFLLGVSTSFAVTIAINNHIRDRMDLASLIVEKKLDKKITELKYQKVSLRKK